MLLGPLLALLTPWALNQLPGIQFCCDFEHLNRCLMLEFVSQDSKIKYFD